MKKFLLLGLLTACSLASAQTQQQQGYEFLVNANYIGCGVPVTVMKRAQAAKKLLPPAIFESFFPIAASEVFESSSLTGRNEDNANVHPSFNVFETARGVKAMNFNCLSCHGDTLNGQYIVGVGNRSRDFTQNLTAFTRFLPLFAWTSAEKREVEIFQRSMAAIAPYIQTKTVGANPAINLTYALFANRRSDDFTWSDKLTLDPPNTEFPPVDVPPWWRLKLKNSMFYNAEFSKNHSRIMTLASTLCIEDAAAMIALDPPFLDVEAFIRDIKAPVYPLNIDKSLAEMGKPLFESRCSSCHGTYSEDGSTTYTTKVIPIETIRTDSALMEQQTGPEHERFRKWGEDAFTMLYGESFGVEKHLGYVVPPLNGIWATAPFLHNGSVPSLEAVLNSKIRPKFWLKVGVGADEDYDVAQVAVKFKALTYGQREALPFKKRYIYDTTLKGYGNQGHTFGDSLSDSERLTVMEYLKTL